MTTIGTEVFMNFISAGKYYKNLGYSDKEIWEKVKNKEILIGQAAFRNKYGLVDNVIDKEGRFHIIQ